MKDISLTPNLLLHLLNVSCFTFDQNLGNELKESFRQRTSNSSAQIMYSRTGPVDDEIEDLYDVAGDENVQVSSFTVAIQHYVLTSMSLDWYGSE